MSDRQQINIGATVRTTIANMDKREEWTDRAWAMKRWGVEGVVLSEHNSHGLCYEVKHEDGTRATYDPDELEVL